MLSEEDWIQLTRYVAGECSAAETSQVETWLAADPTRSAELDELQAAWDLFEPNLNGNGHLSGDGQNVARNGSLSRAEAQWKRFKRAIADSGQNEGPPSAGER